MTDTITVLVNGDSNPIIAGASVRQLLEQLEIATDRIALELNRNVLPRTQFDRQLSDGDQIEIVTFVGGG